MPKRLVLYVVIAILAALLALMIGEFAGLMGMMIGFVANKLMEWVYENVGRPHETDTSKDEQSGGSTI